MLILLTLLPLTFFNCTFLIDDSNQQSGTEGTHPEGFQIEQAFPGEEGEVRNGYALINGELRKITFDRINGCNVFEGDILIPDEHIFESPAEYESSLDKSIIKTSHKWPGGKVHFRISSDVYNEQIIREAIAHWQNQTV